MHSSKTEQGLLLHKMLFFQYLDPHLLVVFFKKYQLTCKMKKLPDYHHLFIKACFSNLHVVFTDLKSKRTKEQGVWWCIYKPYEVEFFRFSAFI